MSKKILGGAKSVELSSAPALPLLAVNSSKSVRPTPANQLEQPWLQLVVDLKFAEGSSFLSMPHEEQKRLMDYLSIYRKELPRLIEQGEAGRFAVIECQNVAHVWDTAEDAFQAATLLIGGDQFAVYQVKLQDAARLLGDETTKDATCPR